MKAVILSAGSSSRMWPLATGKHKSLYQVCGRTLLERTIDNLASNGFKEVIAVVDKRDVDSARKLAAPSNAKITVAESKNHEGMGAELLSLGLGGKRFVVTSGHSVNAGENARKLMQEADCDAVLCAQHADNVAEYGAVKIGKKGTVESVTEKPKEGGKGLRIVGTYVVGSKFIGELEKTKPSHYSFEDALGSLVKKRQVKAVTVEGYQPTLKYPWHLLSLKNFIMERELPKEPVIEGGTQVDDTAIIRGKVVICSGAHVMENAIIKGPAFIGNGSLVGSGVLVRDYADIGRNVIVGFGTEVKNSLVLDGSHLHHCSVEDSVVDSGCRIGAFSVLANRRFDRHNITSAAKQGMVDTGLDFFGAVLGGNVMLGVNSSAMPGVKIGANARVMPNFAVKKDVKEGETVGN